MTVADYLQNWKAAHNQAKAARFNRNPANNAVKLQEAQQALLDAHALDPDLTDPAWATLPCSLSDLNTFYASQLDVTTILAPRFQKPIKVEQAALVAMKASQDEAKAKANL